MFNDLLLQACLKSTCNVADIIALDAISQAQVQQWQDFATTAIDQPLSNWVYQILGWMAYNPQVTAHVHRPPYRSRLA
eukprot:SAG31_NODE_23072_length_512_cov_0.658596_1_plen_77_part_10